MGFVIARTTYSFDTKWAEFLTILNDNIRFCFTLHNNQHISHLHEKHVLTVLEDPAKLKKKNANLDLTARVFTDWVQSPKAKSEREGTVLANRWSLSPHYEFYLHVDETTLNQVLRQHTSRKPIPADQKWRRSGCLYGNEDNFSVKVVYAQQVQAYRAYREEIAKEQGMYSDMGLDEDEEEVDEDESLNMMKRVRIFEIPDLYAVLADRSSMWFNIVAEGDVMDI